MGFVFIKKMYIAAESVNNIADHSTIDTNFCPNIWG